MDSCWEYELYKHVACVANSVKKWFDFLIFASELNDNATFNVNMNSYNIITNDRHCF